MKNYALILLYKKHNTFTARQNMKTTTHKNSSKKTKHIALTIGTVAQCLFMTGCGTLDKVTAYRHGDNPVFAATKLDAGIIYKAVTPARGSDFGDLEKIFALIALPFCVLDLPLSLRGYCNASRGRRFVCEQLYGERKEIERIRSSHRAA